MRALRILREVHLIAAEDTRTTGRLLAHYEIDTPLISYHEYSGPGRIDELLNRLAAGDVALVSDAGMPGLSDPGYRLVEAAVAAGITVTPIPGPAAAVTALVASGLPTDSFLFLGFLPRQKKGRRDALAAVKTLSYTLVLYEAPHRLLDLLADVAHLLGQRRLTIGRELTKMHEEIWRGTPDEAIAHFGQGRVRGEVTVVIAGVDPDEARWDETAVRGAAEAQLAQGKSRKEAAAHVAARSGWRKRDVYALLIPGK